MIKLPVKAVRREWEDAKGWINESWSLLDADGNELLGSEDDERLEEIADALNASAPTPERAMVAGDGWKRKTQDAVSALLTQAMKTLPFRDEAAAVDALLAEVTELPEPQYKTQTSTINQMKRTYVIGEKGFEICSVRAGDELQVAAALIRAAKGTPNG